MALTVHGDALEQKLLLPALASASCAVVSLLPRKAVSSSSLTAMEILAGLHSNIPTLAALE